MSMSSGCTVFCEIIDIMSIFYHKQLQLESQLTFSFVTHMQNEGETLQLGHILWKESSKCDPNPLLLPWYTYAHHRPITRQATGGGRISITKTPIENNWIEELFRLLPFLPPTRIKVSLFAGYFPASCGLKAKANFPLKPYSLLVKILLVFHAIPFPLNIYHLNISCVK